MDRAGTFCFVLVGAFVGGVFPGALLAFSFASASGVHGDDAETACLIINLFLGAAGSFVAFLVGTALAETKVRVVPAAASLILGLLAGMGGYYWALCEINHADLPL
jgi:hypothetical protein